MSGPEAYRAALYMRLSKDDEGAGESSSITNQRNMLTAYAGEHGYRICCEYVDDGYSGTSFDRPAFQRMLRDIEAKRVNLVLTKDLSRLGRDYIQTGQYTEVYFPAKKVRYIAVNDGFDSESQYTDIAPFKHVVNEMYARDASKKIRSAFAAKMRGGSYIGNFAPYGYQKDPGDRNHLVPDGAAAAVVQKIFALAAAGARPAEIARYLNGRGVLSPALYRCARHPQLREEDYTKRRAWTAAGVGKLLDNIVYLGHMAQGKTTKVSFKSKLTLRNPPQDWIIVENTHEPIVAPELYELAQRRRKSRTCGKKGEFSNIFSGVARCADCGRGMSTVGTRKKGSPASLACGGYKLYGSKACTNHFIDYNALYRVVLEAVREQAALTPGERAALYRTLSAQLGAELDAGDGAGEAERLRGERGRLERLIGQLYDDRLEGKLSEARFYRLLEKYEGQSRALEERLDALPGPADGADREEALARLAELVEQSGAPAQLTAGLLFALVDRIEVGQGRYEQTEHGRVKRQEITIYFRFAHQPQVKEVAL